MSTPPLKKKSVPTYESHMFLGKVTEVDGKRSIAFTSEILWQHYLKEMCKLGDNVALMITNKRPKRTLCQNSYLHLYLGLIGLSTGYTVPELKAWYKKFLSQGISEVFGTKVRKVKSSKDLNIIEFMELIDKIEEESGIPQPDTKPFNLPMFKAEFLEKKRKQEEKYIRMQAKI